MIKKGGKVASAEHPVVQKKINKSLELSIKEGSLASVSTGLGSSYFVPFALALSATSSQIGILHAIINLLPSLSQLKSAKLISKFSRKQIVLKSVLVTILLWIPILISGILFYFGIPYMVWAFIFFVGLFYALGAVAQPAWFSWMGSLVPKEKRGFYFSRRNRITGFFGIITMIIGAIILDGAKNIGGQYGDVVGFTLIGFGLLFIVAAITRLWSWFLFKKQYEPRLDIRKKDYFSFGQFLNKCTSTNFGRFVLFRGALGLVVGIAGPFWAVYMLRDLGFSYFWYMAITVSGIIFQLIFFPLLGKASDRFGNIKLMNICSWLIAIIPILWMAPEIIGSDLGIKFYLLFVPSIISGFSWAGYNLAVNNYVYDAVKTPKVGFGLSYMNLVVGVGVFIGASIGSLLAWIDISFMNPLVFIFGVSAVGRLLVSFFGLKYLREVRYVKKFSPQYLIKEFQPMQGVVREIHNLGNVVEKVEHFILPEDLINWK